MMLGAFFFAFAKIVMRLTDVRQVVVETIVVLYLLVSCKSRISGYIFEPTKQ
jgi:hypothetical protein